MYRAVFSRRAERAFLDLPMEQARRVKEAIQRLEQEPRGPNTIKLDHAPIAEYRCRVGNLRILFDIDDANKIVAVLDIRKRDEQTYR